MSIFTRKCFSMTCSTAPDTLPCDSMPRQGRHEFASLSKVQEVAMLLLIALSLLLTECSGSAPSCFSKRGGITLLDHLNINHEAGRHDLVKEFYFETLGMAIDPRKEENIIKGRKGLWANAGITQFHLAEGEKAQVLDGVITVAYPSGYFQRLGNKLKFAEKSILGQSRYSWRKVCADEFAVVDPWGTQFRLIADDTAVDVRGVQPGPNSKPTLITDMNFNVPIDASLKGISRFYKHVFDAPTLSMTDKEVRIVASPFQTITFTQGKNKDVDHAELEMNENGGIHANHGAHISIYVKDLRASFNRAESLGPIFVNKRFKRQANTIEEAVDQCMFRVLEIVDPQNIADGPIVKLEHEIRSLTNRDGSKYKSCPFYEDVVDKILETSTI